MMNNHIGTLKNSQNKSINRLRKKNQLNFINHHCKHERCLKQKIEKILNFKSFFHKTQIFFLYDNLLYSFTAPSTSLSTRDSPKFFDCLYKKVFVYKIIKSILYYMNLKFLNDFYNEVQLLSSQNV